MRYFFLKRDIIKNIDSKKLIYDYERVVIKLYYTKDKIVILNQKKKKKRKEKKKKVSFGKSVIINDSGILVLKCRPILWSSWLYNNSTVTDSKKKNSMVTNSPMHFKYSLPSTCVHLKHRSYKITQYLKNNIYIYISYFSKERREKQNKTKNGIAKLI